MIYGPPRRIVNRHPRRGASPVAIATIEDQRSGKKTLTLTHKVRIAATPRPGTEGPVWRAHDRQIRPSRYGPLPGTMPVQHPAGGVLRPAALGSLSNSDLT